MESEYLQRLNIQTLIDDLAVSGVGLPENGIPAIEAPSMTIGYRNISQLNFADELIYNGASNNIIPPTVSYLNKETLYISKLVRI
jgi:hypothetical protein